MTVQNACILYMKKGQKLAKLEPEEQE